MNVVRVFVKTYENYWVESATCHMNRLRKTFSYIDLRKPSNLYNIDIDIDIDLCTGLIKTLIYSCLSICDDSHYNLIEAH